MGVAAGTTLTREHILRLVIHPEGCLKAVPPDSRKVALLTHADSSRDLEQAKDLASDLLKAGFERAVIASFITDRPVKDVMHP